MRLTLRKILAVLLTLTMVISVPVTLQASEDYMTVSVDVTYCQTEARSMLDMINDFRTGDDAWYWNSDDTTQTVSTDLDELEYDYALEAIAMQRAVEIAIFYSHTRPNGESCFGLTDSSETTSVYWSRAKTLQQDNGQLKRFLRTGRRRIITMKVRATGEICWTAHILRLA